jgi:cephalosporin-C deacetylase-like acetyl esterase
MKNTFLLLAFALLLSGACAQNLLPEKWKFNAGDDPSWASITFDDSGWAEITPGTSWEKQGYPGLDGFAWYRTSVIIPSTMKEVAAKYGGLSLRLGKIDDVDLTYFNEMLIGKTGELPPDYVTQYNVGRDYVVPFKYILWDRPNAIAVRVFDLWGDGGIYGFPIQLTIKGLSDELSIEPVFSRPDYILEGPEGASLTLNMINRSKKDISGNVSLKVVSDFGNMVASYNNAVDLKKKESFPVNFPLPGIQPGFYKVYLTFEGPLAFRQEYFGFGYEPEKIVSPPNRLPDFDEYWQRAKQELAAVDPQFRVIRMDSLCTSKRNVYLVEMRSLDDVLIRGWYSVPAAPGKYPALMLVPGYSGTLLPEYVDYGDDMIGLALNIRGHGNSRDDVNPGFPGYLFSGIKDKETYIYRGAYMDCLRGIDFLYFRPEVDTTRVGVEGSSQGGALSFATAALDNARIKVCAPQIPFLSDFPDYFRTAPWPADEFTAFVETKKEMSWEEVFSTLSYIDIKNLAGWIKAPLLMGVGLVDDVCPPHINFAAYNQVSSEKHYLVYPEAGHGMPEDFYIRKTAFIREKFGLE